MTELKQKAIDFIRKTKCSSYINTGLTDLTDEELSHLYFDDINILVDFATLITKEFIAIQGLITLVNQMNI